MAHGQQTRRWLEAIHLRSSETEVRQVARQIGTRIGSRPGLGSIVRVQLLVSPTRWTDLAVHIHHETQASEPPDETFGQLVVELCEERGLVHRTLWLEVDKEQIHERHP